LRQSGSLFNAAAVIAVASLLIMFGVRPAIRALLEQPALVEQQQIPALAATETMISLGHQQVAEQPAASLLIEAKEEKDEIMDAILARKDKLPQRHLHKLVDFDDEHAAAVLKQWMRQGANA
jgi:flagellar M-ring protein FliF